MNAVRAIWTNGRILPSEPVDWPDGIQLLVEPVSAGEKIGLDESDWRDDPGSITDWIVAVEKIEPLVWEPGEEEKFLRYREQCRQFNIQAVRRQMETETF